jgi:7SK snRNA methylphosphate capping enzyme
MQIAEHFNPKMIVGIDVDKRLIDAATASLKRAKYVAAQKAKEDAPLIPSSSKLGLNGNLKMIPRSIAASQTIKSAPTALKCQVLAAKMQSSTTESKGTTFPNNVLFTCKNIMEYEAPSPKYDVVLCLSVTKWIHLNDGDEGLLRLFRTMYQLTNTGGRLILEYQPWSSYLNRRKTSERTEQVFDTLKVKPEDFERILVGDIGYRIELRLGTPLSESKGFKRPILVLIKDPVAATTSATSKMAATTYCSDYSSSLFSDGADHVDNRPFNGIEEVIKPIMRHRVNLELLRLPLDDRLNSDSAHLQAAGVHSGKTDTSIDMDMHGNNSAKKCKIESQSAGLQELPIVINSANTCNNSDSSVSSLVDRSKDRGGTEPSKKKRKRGD